MTIPKIKYPERNDSSLSSKEVEHIASLARVRLDQEEVEKYRTQLSDILEHFRTLQDIDTEGVVPKDHPTLHAETMRDDQPLQSLDKEKALANAPNRQGDYFRVRSVLE